jgi:hypothetical protein
VVFWGGSGKRKVRVRFGGGELGPPGSILLGRMVGVVRVVRVLCRGLSSYKRVSFRGGREGVRNEYGTRTGDIR